MLADLCRTSSRVSEVINEQDECGGYVHLKALVTEGLSCSRTKGGAVLPDLLYIQTTAKLEIVNHSDTIGARWITPVKGCLFFPLVLFKEIIQKLIFLTDG